VTRDLPDPVAATFGDEQASLISAQRDALANARRRATIRVALLAGSYSRMRPLRMLKEVQAPRQSSELPLGSQVAGGTALWRPLK